MNNFNKDRLFELNQYSNRKTQVFHVPQAIPKLDLANLDVSNAPLTTINRRVIDFKPLEQ